MFVEDGFLNVKVVLWGERQHVADELVECRYDVSRDTTLEAGSGSTLRVVILEDDAEGVRAHFYYWTGSRTPQSDQLLFSGADAIVFCSTGDEPPKVSMDFAGVIDALPYLHHSGGSVVSVVESIIRDAVARASD